MKATQTQLNIIANCVNKPSDSFEREGARMLARRLFPESVDEIEHAIREHPIIVRWDEYIKCKSSAERAAFELSEVEAPQYPECPACGRPGQYNGRCGHCCGDPDCEICS